MYTLIFGFLIAVVVIGITYVYFKRQNEKQAQLEEADWLTGLQTQLPVEAADAFEAAYDEAAKTASLRRPMPARLTTSRRNCKRSGRSSASCCCAARRPSSWRTFRQRRSL